MDFSEHTPLFCLSSLLARCANNWKVVNRSRPICGFYQLAATCQEEARAVGVGLGNFVINTLDDATGLMLIRHTRGLNCGSLEIAYELKVTVFFGLELGLLVQCLGVTSA